MGFSAGLLPDGSLRVETDSLEERTTRHEAQLTKEQTQEFYEAMVKIVSETDPNRTRGGVQEGWEIIATIIPDGRKQERTYSNFGSIAISPEFRAIRDLIHEALPGVNLNIKYQGFITPRACGESLEQSSPATAKPKRRPLLWHKSLKAGLADARRRQTSVLVRVGTVGCGWCRQLDNEFAKSEVQRELANWTLVTLDAETNFDEVRQLRVGPVPALRILNESGRVLRVHNGYLPSAELIAWLRASRLEPRDKLRDKGYVPELTAQSVKEVVRLLAHREAGVREEVSQLLAANRELAAKEVVSEFSRGPLAFRLAALEVLTAWQAPVEGLDPWRPETITAARLEALKAWAEGREQKGAPVLAPNASGG